MSLFSRILKTLGKEVAGAGVEALSATLDGDPSTSYKQVAKDYAYSTLDKGQMLASDYVKEMFEALDTSAVFGAYQEQGEAHLAEAIALALRNYNEQALDRLS